MTKTELAQVVIQALYNLDELPKPTHWHVVRKVRYCSKSSLEDQYKMALRVFVSKEAA